MSGFKVLLDNKVNEDAALSVTPSAASVRMGVENLIDPMIGNKLRVMGSGLTITIEFAADVVVDVVGILYHNLTDSAVITVDAMDSGDVVLATAQPSVTETVVARFNSQSCRKLAITISNNDSDDGDVLIGRVLAGQLWTTQYGFQRGVQIPSPQRSTVKRAWSGAPQTLKRESKRGISLSFNFLSQDEAITLLQLQLGYGYLFLLYDQFEMPLESFTGGVYFLPAAPSAIHSHKNVLGYQLRLEEF